MGGRHARDPMVIICAGYSLVLILVILATWLVIGK